jgi:lysophospholipase L1-like esterase
VALAVLALLAGCTGPAGERTLPADRSARVVYVALGDSTVEGVGASSAGRTYVGRFHQRLRDVYPQATAINLGVAGATAADVVGGQLERAVGLGPTLVTLSVGPNDITGRIAVDDFTSNVATIFRRLTRETTAVVVANLLPDLAVTPRFRQGPAREVVGRRTVEFNDALRRTAGEYGVAVVDLYGPSREEVPRRPELISGDGYHPSDEGYARWAELLWQGVESRRLIP